MAYTVTSNIPLNMPTPGTREPAQIALLNENCVTLSNHDHTTGKALAVGRLRSGLAANRPAAGQAGNVYFATDTGEMSVDTGTAWVQFLTATGQIALTDPIIRDRLQFGAKPNGAVDYTVTRVSATALQFSGNVGVGVAPAALLSTYQALQVARSGVFMAGTGNADTIFGQNVIYAPGGAAQALYAGPGVMLNLINGEAQIKTAPSVAAGAAQTFTTRLTVEPGGDARFSAAAGSSSTITLDAAADQYKLVRFHTASVLRWQMGTAPSPAPPDEFHLYSFNDVGALTGDRLKVSRAGTVTLTPDAATAALVWGNGRLGEAGAGSGIPEIYTVSAVLNVGRIASYTKIYGNSVYLDSAPGGGVFPERQDAVLLGTSTNRWGQVWCTQGAFSGSHVSLKENFAPLDAGACVEAVLTTDWLAFDYKAPPPPVPVPPPADETDEQREAREAVEAQNRELVEQNQAAVAMARKQKGYVLGSDEYHTADLFGMADRQNASTHADLAVVACALQDALRRLAALEANNAAAA